MTKSVVVIGPYIGDLEQELFAFRPYARYITSTVEADQYIVSSHFNRSFLYDWIPQENFIPVFESLTREEEKQSGYMHDDISRTDYTQLVKYLKNKVREVYSKADIDVYSPPYIKSINSISIYQKEFTPISFPRHTKSDINTHEIIFIVDKSKDIEKIYDTLRCDYDIIVLGNMLNGIEYENIALKSTDYYINGYVDMMNYIHHGSLLVTNCPSWAIIGNLMSKDMVFWGDRCAQFKEDGLYGFGNRNAVSVDIGSRSIVDMIKYKMERLQNAVK